MVGEGAQKVSFMVARRVVSIYGGGAVYGLADMAPKVTRRTHDMVAWPIPTS